MPVTGARLLIACLLAAFAAGCGPDTTVDPPTTAPLTPPPPASPPGSPPAAQPDRSGFGQVEFRGGWQPIEVSPTGQEFRWMGTTATLVVDGSQPDELSFAAASLVIPRTLTVRLSNRVLARAHLPRKGGRRVTVRLPSARGSAVLRLQAKPGATPAAEVIPGDPRKLAVMITQLQLGAGDSPEAAPTSEGSVAFGRGWHAPEQDPAGRTFRWMQTEGELTVGPASGARPALRLAFAAGSLVKPRTLRVSLPGRTLAELRIPGDFKRYAVQIPSGTGPAKLLLQAIPGAEPASVVTPGDNRQVAVALREPKLTRSQSP